MMGQNKRLTILLNKRDINQEQRCRGTTGQLLPSYCLCRVLRQERVHAPARPAPSCWWQGAGAALPQLPGEQLSPVQSRRKALLASGSLQSFPSKKSSGYQEGKQRPHTMRSVSGRGSQEAHSKAQLLGSELPFQLQAGSSVPGHFCFPIQQVVDLEPSTLAQKT